MNDKLYDSRKIGITDDEKSHMFFLIEKYKDKTLEDQDVLDLSSLVLKYLEIYFPNSPEFLIDETDYGVKNKGKKVTAFYSLSKNNISLCRWYIDMIKSGDVSFFEFTNTVFHENNHYLAKSAGLFLMDHPEEISEEDRKFIMTANNSKTLNPEISKDYINSFIAMVNKKNEENIFSKLGKDNCLLIDEFKDRVRSMKDELLEADADIKLISDDADDYDLYDLSYDMHKFAIYLSHKLSEENAKINPFAFKKLIEMNRERLYIKSLRQISDQILTNYKYCGFNVDDVVRGSYLSDTDEEMARTSAIQKNWKLYSMLPGEKELSKEVQEFFIDGADILIDITKFEELYHNRYYGDYKDFVKLVKDKFFEIYDDNLFSVEANFFNEMQVLNNSFEENLGLLKKFIEKNKNGDAKQLIKYTVNNLIIDQSSIPEKRKHFDKYFKNEKRDILEKLMSDKKMSDEEFEFADLVSHVSTPEENKVILDYLVGNVISNPTQEVSKRDKFICDVIEYIESADPEFKLEENIPIDDIKKVFLEIDCSIDGFSNLIKKIYEYLPLGDKVDIIEGLLDSKKFFYLALAFDEMIDTDNCSKKDLYVRQEVKDYINDAIFERLDDLSSQTDYSPEDMRDIHDIESCLYLTKLGTKSKFNDVVHKYGWFASSDDYVHAENMVKENQYYCPRSKYDLLVYVLRHYTANIIYDANVKVYGKNFANYTSESYIKDGDEYLEKAIEKFNGFKRKTSSEDQSE